MPAQANEWVFVSPHPPEDVERMIADARAPRSWLGRGTGVRGSAGGRRLRLYHVQRGRQNSFVPVFDGRIEESGIGSRIVGKFRLHLAVRIFMIFWLGFVACFFVGGVVNAISELASGGFRGEDAIFVGIPLLMLLFGVGLVTFGRYGMGAKAEQATVEFIAATVNGSIEQRPSKRSGKLLGGRIPIGSVASIARDFSKIRFRDIARTRSGLALLATSYGAGGALMYVWMRPGFKGCAGDHKFDPHYYCPGDISFVIWITMVTVMAIGAFGALTWVRKQWCLLSVVIAVQLAFLAVGIGYVNYPPMQPHPLPAGETDSPDDP